MLLKIENITYFCYKTSYPNKEVNSTELSRLVSVPCFWYEFLPRYFGAVEC
jgi:hypothetical protein